MTSDINNDNHLDGKPCDGENRYKLIDDYLSGKLSIAEMEAFGEHMIVCPACMAEMAFRKEVIEMVEDEGAELFTQAASKVDITVKSEPDSDKSERKKRNSFHIGFLFTNHKWGYGLLAAASLALFIIITQVQKQSSESPYNFVDKVPYSFEAEYLNASSMRPQTRVDTNTTSVFRSRFIDIMTLYESRKYETTINALIALEDDLLDLQTIKEERVMTIIREYYFYRGVSRLAYCTSDVGNQDTFTDCMTATIADLQQAQKMAIQNHFERYDRDTYFLALAFNLSGMIKATKQELNKINYKDEFWDQAKTLQNKLNKIPSN